MTEAIEHFDAITFLNELIEEMGMANEDPKELTLLKEQMAEALHNTIFQAASDAIEPEVIDMVMEELKDEKDPWIIVTELIKTSPSAQLAMLEALDRFRENTLEAYNQLK
jgi:hypothetical protein